MFKKSLIALGIVGAAALPSVASAITIDGITFAPGVTLVIGTIYEGEVSSNYTAPISAVGQELGGVGIVDAIKDAGGNTVWSNGTNGRELTFQFGGYLSEAPTAGPPIGINFSQGWVNFYSDSAQNFVTSPIATMLANATDGNQWLNLLGGDTGVACTGGPCTLESYILSGTLGAIASGVGNGFLDVNMGGTGAANASFDTNGVTGGHDFALGSSFNSENSTGAMFASGSFDLRTNSVPEPGTLALFGLGLLGFASMARRGSKNKAA